MKVADLILLLAPLSDRTISLRHSGLLMALDRECLQVLDEENAVFEMPAPARVTLDDALCTLADWVRHAELRIAALEENGPAGIDYSELALNLDMSDLAGEVDRSDLAGYVDMSDLAQYVDMSDLAGHLNIDDAVEEAVNDTLRDARFRLA